MTQEYYLSTELYTVVLPPMHALSTGTYGAYSSDTSSAAAALTWTGKTGERLRSISDVVDLDSLSSAQG